VGAKVALTDFAAFMVSVQVDEEPEQEPPQPEKSLPVAGVAVRVTWVPLTWLSLQSPGQLIPEPATVPEPLVETVSV